MESFPYPNFLLEHGNALSKTLDRTISVDPAFVVAIARRGPRLIELAEKYDIWLPPKGLKIISDTALLFISSKKSEHTVSVFDDVLIYGSTMRRVLNMVLEKGFFPVPFVLAKGDVHPGFQTNAFYTLSLPKSQFSAFNSESVMALRYLSKPYDINHPLFYISLKPELVLKKDIVQLIKKCYPKCYDLTNDLESRIGIVNLTILDWKDELPPLLIPRYTETFPQSTKVRIIVNLRTRIVTIEPISLFDIHAKNILDGKLPFINEIPWLNELTRNIVDFVNKIDSSDTEKELAIVCTTTYLAEWLYGYSFILDSELFEKEEKETPVELMKTFDMDILLGQELSKKFQMAIKSSESLTKETLKGYLSLTGRTKYGSSIS